ncbi:MAG: hypothetical protein ACREBU_21715 [Nitrososphaera sp.]
MSVRGDWIRLLVKYRGKCVQCGKEIPQGEYALWSRTAKSIKHERCEPAQAQGSGEGDQLPTSKELDCFICGKPAGCPACEFEQMCNRDLVSQACICDKCFSDGNAYENYQQAFVVRLGKGANLKIRT